MEFAPYDQNEALIRSQQDSLTTVCKELGLGQ